jgi:hypothetical protein
MQSSDEERGSMIISPDPIGVPKHRERERERERSKEEQINSSLASFVHYLLHKHFLDSHNTYTMRC